MATLFCRADGAKNPHTAALTTRTHCMASMGDPRPVRADSGALRRRFQQHVVDTVRDDRGFIATLDPSASARPHRAIAFALQRTNRRGEPVHVIRARNVLADPP